MKKGWNRTRLGEACDLISRGIAPSYIEEGGIRVVNQKCIRDHRIDYALSRRNDARSKKVPSERIIRLGDVLVNSTGTGTLGRVAQVRQEPGEPTTVDTHVSILRPKERQFLPEFFGYMLLQIEDQLIAGGLGASGQTELPRSDLENKYSVSYPVLLEEQQRIVAILDEAFEGLDRARANAEANLRNARELFGAARGAMLGENNKNWITKKVSECFKLKSGDGLTSKEMIPGPFPVFGGNGVAGTHNASNLDGKNVIVGRVGALCGNARFVDGPVWLTDNAFKVISCDGKFDPLFLSHLLNFKNLRTLARQAAQPVISNSSLADLELCFPNSLDEQIEIAAKIEDFTAQLSSIRQKYENKIYGLNQLRQSLLGKAFAGQLI